jgi:hypothetical protein
MTLAHPAIAGSLSLGNLYYIFTTLPLNTPILHIQLLVLATGKNLACMYTINLGIQILTSARHLTLQFLIKENITAPLNYMLG